MLQIKYTRLQKRREITAFEKKLKVTKRYGWGGGGCGCLQTQSHGSPGSRLQGVRSLEAQTPGSRMESWAGQGHECLCPPVGRENWGTGCQSPWRVRDDSSGFLGTTVGT